MRSYNRYQKCLRSGSKIAPEEFIKTEINLIESESEIVGLRKYYNDIITDYNKLVKNCPSNLVALFKGYKAKDYFDGHNVDEEKGAVKL